VIAICCNTYLLRLVPQTHMTDEIAIRPASPADYEPTGALFDQLDALHREQLPWLFRAPSERPRSQDYFDTLSASDRGCVLVAEAGGLVGLACVRLQRAPELAVFIPQTWGVLDDLVVSATFRRRGVGARLLGAAESWVMERGAAWLELGVYNFNADARAFYEALGYSPVSTKLRRPLPGPG
jgi:GNAT superfamily N-acetyltransferase